MNTFLLVALLVVLVALSGCTQPGLNKERVALEGEFKIELKTGYGLVNDVLIMDYGCNNSGYGRGCEYVGKKVRITGLVYSYTCGPNEQCWVGRHMDPEDIELIEILE